MFFEFLPLDLGLRILVVRLVHFKLLKVLLFSNFELILFNSESLFRVDLDIGISEYSLNRDATRLSTTFNVQLT